MQCRLVLMTFLTLIATGCGNSSGGSSATASSTAVTPTMSGPPEMAYCATPVTYANAAVTITGQAQYNRREIFGNATSGGLGSANPADPTHPASVHPIRYAEVRVTDASGNVVQCAETAADGTFSLSLPQGSATYTVAVQSRSAPAPQIDPTPHLYASVLDQPNTNKVYALTTNVSGNQSQSVGTLTAPADGTLLGGAFNILDQLLNANEYLVTQVGQCASQYALCSNYDPSLHKVTTYWAKGFNPNDYFGPGGSGLSFYLPGYSRLFICGGASGDIDHSDTDHFDNSVIIHEYGHFLEDNWLKTDSPGGAHDGDELLDPRLAWSEGWGDFIQAAVRGDSHYIDSIGNVDGQTELEYYLDTENTSSGSDYPRFPGEGNFREMAVTRLLWDSVDDTPSETGFGAPDDISGGFSQIWATLSKTQYGFRDTNYSFRNAGLMLESQRYLQNHPATGDAAAPNWSNISTLNQTEVGESHYAQTLILSSSGACSASPSITPTNSYLPAATYYFSLTPATIPDDYGGLSTSDLFQNNRFFRLHIDSSQVGSHTLQLVYEDDDGIPVVADLDLYLYDQEGRFGMLSDMINFSRNYPFGGQQGERVLQTETITTDFSAGDYLINVNVYVGNNVGTTADYNLTLDGVTLCPGSLVPP